jgi:hypothetical protein
MWKLFNQYLINLSNLKNKVKLKDNRIMDNFIRKWKWLFKEKWIEFYQFPINFYIFWVSIKLIKLMPI